MLVQPNGSKLWRFKYRFTEKEKLISFGSYPDVTLASAREKRDDARKQSDFGPRSVPATGSSTGSSRRRRPGIPFGAVAAEHLDNMAANGLAETTLVKNRWMLQVLAAPLAHRPIAEIMPIEVLDLLKRIEKSGRRETARKLRSMIGSVFPYAIVTLRATNDPTETASGCAADA